MGLPVYVRQNQAFVDYFTYYNSGVPVTGKTNASFTRQLSFGGVGNQSVTGIVIAEIDSTNNPGVYSISVPASINAVTGSYDLIIFDTSSSLYRWESQWSVTSDGTGAGTVGAVSFTPTALNGRITDGALPISGATVTIRAPNGTTWATLVSDASGLWGPVYFTASSGTYGIFSTRAGYTQGSANIVVTGIATGPGADIVMAVAASTSGQTAADLWAYGRRTGRDVTGAKAEIEIKQAVNEALEIIAKSHRWPRYLTLAQLSLNGALQGLSVSVVNASTTITLTSGTWPTWANSGYPKLYINGQIIRLASATTGTTATLEAPWQAASGTATAVVLFQDEYLLPDNLYNVVRIMPGTRWGESQMATGPDVILRMQSGATYGQRIPACWGIIKQQMLLFPYPTQNDLLGYSYWRKPAELVVSTDVADWDPAQNEVIRRAIDYTVSLRYGGYAGGTTEQAYAQFKEALARAIPADRESSMEDASLDNNLNAMGNVWRRRQGSP